MLTNREVEMLFEQITRLQARGVSIIYISHRLEELARGAQRIAVLRDGNLVCVEPMANYNSEQLVTLMVGRELGEQIDMGPRKISAPALTVKGLTRSDKVRDVSFEVRAGEIYGISGLIGAGRTEIALGLCGLRPLKDGTVMLGNQDVTPKTYADSIANGIVYLSEDRKGAGVFVDLPIAQNVSALAIGQVAKRGGLVSRRQEQAQAKRLGDSLNLKCGSLDDAVSTLSGGNQQKVAIAKMLSVNSHMFVKFW